VAGTIRSGDADGEIGNIVTDTRTLQPGDFFIALRGERYDGHAFVAQAFERGAVGAIVERGFTGAESHGRRGVIEVDETTRALQDLAHAVRRSSGTKVIAITGSAGKTTTKEGCRSRCFSCASDPMSR
jgi:UDP-N-acetylmuramoyl-tripeptide--D-alanyl-D-alanine ligase